MKISKVENLENTEPTQLFRKELTEKGGCKNDDLDDLDNENIQLDINKPNIDAVEKKKRIYKKRLLSQTLKSPQ